MIYAVFNGHNLNSDGSEVLTLETQPPNINLNKYELVRSDGSIVTNQSFGARKIIMSGRIKASNRKDLDQKLDTFKSWFVGLDKNLDVYVADVTRRYVATLENMSTTISGYQCDWNITMTADAYGKDISTTALTFGTYTTADTSYTNTILGSYKAKPTIDFTINQCLPYWEAKYIEFRNNAKSQTIRLTRTWNWLDRVVINGEAKTCSLYASAKTVIDTCDDDTDWTSVDTLTLNETDQKEGAGCLELESSGGVALVDFTKLDTTAINLSSADTIVVIPMYIPTPTSDTIDKVVLRVGSNTTLVTNYKSYELDNISGDAINYDEWNYLVFELDDPTATSGTADMSAIISIEVKLYAPLSGLEIEGLLLDYITAHTPCPYSTSLDYEGIFPELDLGSSTITVTDELDSRNITITGNYTKRWL